MLQNKLLKRTGFTLSEMLVVLGILVVITALAQPAMRGALGDSRLRSAAKQVRVELAKARLKAMQTGTAQRFRFQVGKDRFEISPLIQEESIENAVASADADTQPADEPIEQSLPEGIRFDDARAESPSTSAGADEEGWSEPIVFYPNGRTEDAHIRIKGERKTLVEVTLRGLTGVATASRLRHEEDVR